MTSRVTSAAVTLPVLIVAVWAGSPWFTALVAIAAGTAGWEISAIAGIKNRALVATVIVGSIALIAAGDFIARQTALASLVAPFALVGALAGLLALQRLRAPGNDFLRAALVIAAIAYAGGLLFHAPLLRNHAAGMEWVLFLLAVTFATDTGAYFIGRAFGKRPLAPSISPSKTWEGAAGGTLAALAAGFIAYQFMATQAPVWQVVVLAGIAGIAGQLGDLAESKFKRVFDAKESGSILPGHGGILDRLDSIVFSLPVVYYAVKWVIT
ncbi:MAG: phosphatidate cytidylyltransferase [Chloroflexi bacterium]|nr:phosphatidate cytidylyltransferase [Chloroflexota bacterium]